ncbi:DUF4181 domain-containing protein [Salibacterium sp. K-3]
MEVDTIWKRMKRMNLTLMLTVMTAVHQGMGRVLAGKERQTVGDTSGKRIYYTGLTVLLVTSFFIHVSLEKMDDPVFWTLFLIALLLYQAAMERIYLQEPKYYIASLLTLAIGLLYIQFFVL